MPDFYHFKQVNDTFGMAPANHVLRELSHRIESQALRQRRSQLSTAAEEFVILSAAYGCRL